MEVGIDLVELAETAEALAAFGQRYLQRVLTAEEIAAAGSDVDPDRLAECLAVKEATIKAIAPESNDPVPWRSIEVRDLTPGTHEVVLSGASAELAQRRGLRCFSATTATASGHVLAVVIASGWNRRQ